MAKGQFVYDNDTESVHSTGLGALDADAMRRQPMRRSSFDEPSRAIGRVRDRRGRRRVRARLTLLASALALAGLGAALVLLLP